MGHLTRLSAVALCGRGLLESTLFSMSVALPVVNRLGLRGEYCPGVGRGWFPSHLWHSYLRERILAIATELRIDVVAFDGVAPYPGIGQARGLLPDVPFVWFRRGMWRPGVNTKQLKKSAFFDQVIEPGELASAADRGATAEERGAVRIPPITMLDAVDRLTRTEAAARLGLDPDRHTVLVTLGSGRLGDAVAPGRVVLDELGRSSDWQICVTRSDVALQRIPIDGGGRIIELTGVYPLVRHFSAFDAAVSAAGYNAVHEFVQAGIPTLFVPNPATTTDDQIGRARQIAQEGLALNAAVDSPEEIRRAVQALVDDGRRSEIAAACQAVPRSRAGGGAAQAARLLHDLAEESEPRRPTTAQRLRLLESQAKEQTKRLLGPQYTDLVRRILGRAPVESLEARLRVELEGTNSLGASPEVEQLLISADVDPARIRDGGPVEHLLAATSQDYHEERRRIAAKYYEIVD
jgi:hypothetical protein